MKHFEFDTKSKNNYCLYLHLKRWHFISTATEWALWTCQTTRV